MRQGRHGSLVLAGDLAGGPLSRFGGSARDQVWLEDLVTVHWF